MIQKRRHYRAKTFLPTKINSWAAGAIFDISAGGVLLTTNYPLAKDKVIKLDIKLPEYDLKTTCRVAREASNKMYGLEFHNISSEDKAMITKYIFRYCV